MNDLPEISGPVQEPASGNAAKQLIVLLHGYGANGDDLIGLAPPLSQILPDAAFVSPNAPYPCQGNPFGGFQWFDVWQGESEDRLAAVRQAETIVNRFVDKTLEERGLDDSQLAFLGFSQGTMLSLQTALRREKPCAGVLGYSGRLENPELLSAEIRSRTPVMLIHGEDDPMLEVGLMDSAAETLRANDVPVSTHRRPGLGHGIDPDGLKLGAAFLTQCLSA